MKQNKKFLMLVVAFSLMLSGGAREEKSIIDGHAWTYAVTQGDATITGVEPKTGHVKIPAKLGDDDFPVAAIGRWVFKGGKGLVNVEIPDSVESIGDEAFCGCENLKSVSIPDSVEYVGEKAFEGCKNLTGVKIGSRVAKIECRAFEKCVSLKSVTIPDSVKTIGSSAFSDCSGLTNVTMGKGLELIASGAFANCSGSVPGGACRYSRKRIGTGFRCSRCG